jgi:hypothetical protein
MQSLKVVDASDAVSVQSSWREIDRLLRELPDGDDRAENQDRTNCHFDDVAALFFGANQKRVGGFCVLVLWLICRACLFFHDTTLLNLKTGSNDIYHQISATPVSEKVTSFAHEHMLAFVMSISIRFDESFRFYLVCAL